MNNIFKHWVNVCTVYTCVHMALGILTPIKKVDILCLKFQSNFLIEEKNVCCIIYVVFEYYTNKIGMFLTLQ